MDERKIIWSLRAKSDLIEILDFYYTQNKTISYSKKLYETIINSIKILKNYPFIGVNTDIPNVRNLIKGNINVFYEIRDDKVEIITIWHSKKNPENLTISINR